MFQRTLTPAALLVLLFSFVAASPRAQVTAAPEAVAAAVAAPMAVPATAPAALPAPASVATPAVATPATLAFAKGADGLSPKVLAMALDAVACAKARGVSGRNDVLTVIDYSLPSTQPRLWVLDLAKGEVLFHELVAHGRGSGDNYATRFSNDMNSHQTSLGLFLTGGTYQGGNGYSLKLKGLDKGVNDFAEERAIVMHGAWYVSAEQARSQGRLGRSWGCPALSEASAPKVITAIKGGSFVFSYAGTGDWYQKASSSLKACPAAPNAGAGTTVSVAG
ncbi:MAG TPA: murein L,D-transpeptidase catalytic domain family protein [Thermoanaerobaculia bacterium]|nr:murein L,D-transpeptidase catalytic domain family protein [Thermoanaerobaculia bacterium]